MEIKLGKYEFILSKEVLFILNFHKQLRGFDTEKGGIILGTVSENKISLDRLSVPTELDKANRMNFERHRLSAQIIVDYEFFNSDGQVTYLGEWHTHPEKNPTPSETDRKMIRQQFSKNIIHTPFLLLLIQGLEKLYIGIVDEDGLSTTTQEIL